MTRLILVAGLRMDFAVGLLSLPRADLRGILTPVTPAAR